MHLGERREKKLETNETLGFQEFALEGSLVYFCSY
jgi:hypothetical protein